MVNIFNKFFLNVAGNVIDDNSSNSKGAANNINPLDYLHTAFGQPFSNDTKKYNY
jgi:hypothetical protein